MGKAELIERLGELESQIAQDEADLPKWQARQKKMRNNCTGGAIALIVAVLMFFLTSWWLLAIFIALVGVLTALTGIINLPKANELVKLTQGRIIENKGEIAKLRARLMAE